MQADALVLADFTWDVLHHSYAWSTFLLAHVPSIFPDIVAYGIFQMVLGGYGWAMFAFAFVMFLGLSYVCGWFAALISKGNFFSAVFLSEGILAGLFLVDAATSTAFDEGNWDRATCLRCFFLFPNSHGGPLLAALASTCLICMLLERWRHTEAVVLYLLAALALLSDRLLWTEFLAPVSAGLALMSLFIAPIRLRAFLIFGIVAESFLTARFLERFITHMPFLEHPPSQFYEDMTVRAPKFLSDVAFFFHGHVFSAVCVIIPLIFFCMYPLSVIRQPKTDNGVNRSGLFIWLYMSLSALASCYVIIAFYGYNNFSVTSFRYDELFFFMGVPFIVARGGASASRYLVPGVLIFFACVHIAASAAFAPGSVTWRPKYAPCLDALQARYGLKAGVATYWHARPLTIASHWKLQVQQVQGYDASPYYYMTDPLSYMHGLVEPYEPPIYRFIIMDGMDTLGVIRRYGKPDTIKTCEAAEIWIYNDPKRFYADLLK